MSEIVRQVTKRGVRHEPDAPTLELRDVSVAYAAGGGGVSTAQQGGANALEGISFSLEPGERIAIVGPNGAGKSTLFKLIIGTLKPYQGEISIFGHGPRGHICIAYVPQRSQVDWTFPATVEDVVMMGRVGQIGLLRWPGQRDREWVHNSLARVNAGHLAQKQIGELSGGQQQRVFIARALAQEAELLLLDEPMSGLDGPGKERIFDILDALRPDGVTVMVATHDLDLAAERFDRVMLLKRRIIALGRAEIVLSSEHLLRAYGASTK